MTFSEDEIERYARHLVLADVGGPGQQRLKAARVLIVGMGGVGGPAALYLAAAGIGTLGLVDDDTVSLSNLQRQIQFDTADVGASKVEVSARRLTALNPHVEVQTFAERLSPDTASQRVAGWDLVIDGTDDFETRMAVNAACVQARCRWSQARWGPGAVRWPCSRAAPAIAVWCLTFRLTPKPARAWA